MSGRPADAPPARGEAAAEGAPHGVAHALRAAFYHAVAVPLLFIACKVWFGHRVEGAPRSSLPQGGYVVVANHVHYLDCVLIALAVWPRRVVFLVDRCNWDHPVIGVFMRLFECIPTGETLARTRTMLKAVGEVPRRGGVLAVFPEGERTNYHRGLGEFRPGAFSVASHAGAPVVPVVLVQNPPGAGAVPAVRPSRVHRGARYGDRGRGRRRDGGALWGGRARRGGRVGRGGRVHRPRGCRPGGCRGGGVRRSGTRGPGTRGARGPYGRAGAPGDGGARTAGARRDGGHAGRAARLAPEGGGNAPRAGGGPDRSCLRVGPRLPADRSRDCLRVKTAVV